MLAAVATHRTHRMLTRRHLLCCGAAAGLFTSLAGPARAGLLNPCRGGVPEHLQPLLARTFDGRSEEHTS